MAKEKSFLTDRNNAVGKIQPYNTFTLIKCTFAYFVYYITLPFFDLLAEKGVLPPLITAAFPPLAFLGAIIMFYKSRDL